MKTVKEVLDFLQSLPDPEETLVTAYEYEVPVGAILYTHNNTTGVSERYELPWPEEAVTKC